MTPPSGDGTIRTMGTWTLHQAGREFGPYSDEDIRQYIADGKIIESSTIWCEGMEEFVPTASLFPAFPSRVGEQDASPIAAPPKVAVAYASKTTKRPRSTRLAAYRFRIGHRCFIFQIWLIVWTIALGVWLAAVNLMAARELANVAPPPAPIFPGAPASPPPSSTFSLEDMIEGLSVGWMCPLAVWGIVGLPVGIAMVATMENNKREA